MITLQQSVARQEFLVFLFDAELGEQKTGGGHNL